MIDRTWDTVRFKEITESTRLGTSTRSHNVENGVPLIKMGNLEWGYLRLYPLEEIDLQDVTNHNEIKLNEEDFLFNTRNTPELVGKSAIWHSQYPIALADNNILIVHFNNTVFPDFIGYYMNSDIGKSKLRKIASGSTSVAAIYWKDLSKLILVIPPLAEQRKIADILSTWDESIAKTEQLIAALQYRKKGLMQRLLTGQVRFPGFVLSEKVKEAQYGKAPSGWKTFHLEDVTFESRARAASENAVDLTVFGVNNQTGLTTDSKYSADILDRYKIVKPGMFAYNPMRLNIGSIGYCDELLGKGLVSPDYVVFGCKENKLDSKYFSYCIQEYHWKNWVRRAGAGSVRVRIYYKDISVYPIVLPSLFEQRKIAEVLQACDSEINLHTNKLEALRQQKKGLMQRLLTGQVRVKV